VANHAGDVVMYKDALPNHKLLYTVPYGSYHTHGFMSRVDGGPGLHVPFHHIAGT
jgi:hypothetical protein